MNTHKWNIILLLLTLLTLTGLVGCNKKENFNDLQTYIDSEKSAAANHVLEKAGVPFNLPTPVTYIGLVSQEKRTGNANNKNPLIAYPLQALQFVGTLAEGSEIVAFIKAPDNMVYQVKKGDLLGDQYGKITQIDQTHIKVSQPPISSSMSKPAERIITMQLKE